MVVWLKKSDIFRIEDIVSIWFQIFFKTDSNPLIFNIFDHIQGNRSTSTKTSFLCENHLVKDQKSRMNNQQFCCFGHLECHLRNTIKMLRVILASIWIAYTLSALVCWI